MTTAALNRLHNYPDDHLLTRAEVAHILDCSTSVVGNRSYAGLLPMIPGRPVRYFAGDVKVYLRMMGNGVARDIHRSLRIAPEDRQVWSPLHGVTSFQTKSPAATIDAVVKETGYLWKKFKEQQRAKKRKQQRTEKPKS